eukprot:906222-Pyramimonas_sp.AAC.1
MPPKQRPSASFRRRQELDTDAVKLSSKTLLSHLITRERRMSVSSPIASAGQRSAPATTSLQTGAVAAQTTALQTGA